MHVLFTKFNVKKRLDDRFVILTVHKIILTFAIAMHCFIVFALKEKTLKVKLKFATLNVRIVRGTQRQFSEIISSEDDLRSRIFATFVVKFLACLPFLEFSNIQKML